MNILIVDDVDIALDILEGVLLKEGHEVFRAANGRQALDVLRQNHCRLVISDWEMPEMNGLDLCREIRSADFPGYIYFILLTSHNAPDQTVEGLSVGADDFIAKPFKAAEMVQRIRTGERILSLETREVAIFAMAKLAESRDPETGAHLDRVRGHCRLIAQHLLDQGRFPDLLDKAYVRLIYLTSPLHDIGKIGIPDSILLKPGRLSDREFAIMKAHTTIGAETLDAALKEFPGTAFLAMARDIAAAHHERYDGSGYPNGLAADAIPLSARIAALADVYDALTSKRVYKQAFSHDVARAIILEESGSHFDPEIVDAFIKNEDRFRAVTQAPELALT